MRNELAVLPLNIHPVEVLTHLRYPARVADCDYR
jgi:hypothetical protein